jgi:Flp pilus assembly protein TadG
VPATPLPSFGNDDRGSMAVTAVALVFVLTGMSALALDGAHAFKTHQELRKAADAAASAAVHVLPDATQARSIAVEFAARNRPPRTTGEVTTVGEVEIGHWDAATRTFTRDPVGQPLNAVRATASLAAAKGNALPTWFARVFGVRTLDLSVTSTASFEGGSTPCISALSPSASQALRLDSSASIDAPGCEVHVASTAGDALYADSNALVLSQRNCVTGGFLRRSNAKFTPSPQTGCATALDPFASVATPNWSGCQHNNTKIVDKTVTIQPGVYCGGLTIDGNAVVTFAPGTYIIRDGAFRADSNAQLRGEGVGFFLTGSSARLNFNSNTIISFSAPKTGPLAGFVFYQDRAFGGTHVVNSNSVGKLDGAVYLAKGTLDLNSNATWGTGSPCMMIVAGRLHMNSNVRLQPTGDYSQCSSMQGDVNRKRSRLVS